MSDAESLIGRTFDMPGIAGRVVGLLKDFLIIEGRVEGEIPIHKAEASELAVLLSGRLRVTVNGVERQVGPGEYMVFPAGCEHGAVAEEPARVLLCEPMPF
jgi:quercetin dioxygenase-like cupin family protein